MKRRDELVVDAPGFRLDQFLALRLPDLSRGHWKLLIGRGAVVVDGAGRSADFKLKGGERVVVLYPQEGWPQTESFEDWVLHEDDSLIVLNKPAGLLMHPLGGSWLRNPQAALAEKEPNLAGVLLKARPKALKAGVSRCGIVHRLDRQTSGVLLVAKTLAAQENLLEDFKERNIRKIYRAIVRGVPSQRDARVDAPIGRKPGHRRVLVTQFGKAAETSFTVLDSCKSAAIVEARPLTGRTHQIRAHLALIGHPVAGDVEFDKRIEGQPWPERMLLHAYEIRFAHPKTGKPVNFKAPVPKDFKDYWTICARGKGTKRP